MPVNKQTFWEKLPPWAKGAIVATFGAGGTGGLAQLPLNINAEASFKTVSSAYPDADIEVRSWRPFIFRITENEKVTVVETSIFSGEIVDTW